MPATNREAGRNVHIYGAKDPTTALGGLILTPGVTNANFYSMIEIFCIFDSNYLLQDEGDMEIQRDGNPLHPGKYYILTNGVRKYLAHHIKAITKYEYLVRTISASSGTRLGSFRDAIRQRDRRCVITGQAVVNADIGIWTGFEAAYVFPLAYEQHWINNNFSRWITILAAKGGAINSIQNGMLLENTIHALFDSYHISINPDDNYQVVCFINDCFINDWRGIAGKHLDQQFPEDPSRPVDQLFRWHFRQAVFANMRGAGEPVFECDFPPGSDTMGEIISGPKAAERMEFELFSRLAAGNEEKAIGS
ncbi:MAG: hypothetical protein M1840_002026 [Geoglossum simile]|nr:MAG: hypothetical protein M1840_002026 [Geoglossum simile]